MPARVAGAMGAHSHGLAGDGDTARDEPLAGESAHEVALPVTLDAGEPNDLPGRDRERYVGEAAPHASTTSRTGPCDGVGRRVLLGKGRLERPADDEFDDLVGGEVRHLANADHPAVAQHGELVRDLARPRGSGE